MAILGFKTAKEKDAERKKKLADLVTTQQQPPSKVTGSGIPMKQQAAVIQEKIRNRKTITDADLYTKTEYVAQQRQKAGLPSAEEIRASIAKKTKKKVK
jgi:hypothetical protein